MSARVELILPFIFVALFQDSRILTRILQDGAMRFVLC